MSRATISDTGTGRFGVLGTTNYADATISLIFRYTVAPSTAGTQRIGAMLVRYTNTSNYVTVFLSRQVSQYVVQAVKVVAGVPTTLGQQINLGNTIPLVNTWYEIVFVMRSNEGRYDIQFKDPTTDSVYSKLSTLYGDIDSAASWGAKDTALAAAGTLATGKIGLLDFNPTVVAGTRYYGQLRATAAIDSGTMDIFYRHSSR